MGTRVQGAPGEDLGFPGPKNKSRFPNALGNLFSVCIYVFYLCFLSAMVEYWSLELRR